MKLLLEKENVKNRNRKKTGKKQKKKEENHSGETSIVNEYMSFVQCMKKAIEKVFCMCLCSVHTLCRRTEKVRMLF